MKREEEIKHAAHINEDKANIDSYNAFIRAAKWADRTMIEKACDWIQMNAMKYVNSIGGCMYFDVINSTKDFRKAMEL